MTRKIKARPPAGRPAEPGLYWIAAANALLAAVHPLRPSRKRARRIVATLTPPLAALAFAAALIAPAQALTTLQQGWQVANSKCVSGDAKQCDLRDRLSATLKRKRCVFQEDGAWWKCPR